MFSYPVLASGRGGMTLRRSLVLLAIASLLAGLGLAMPVVRERALASSYVAGPPETVTYYVSDGAGGVAGCATADASTGDYADDASAIDAALTAAAGDGVGGIVVIHLCAGTFDMSGGVSVGLGDATTQTVIVEGEGTGATTVRRSPAASTNFRFFTVSGVRTIFRQATFTGALALGAGLDGAVISSNADVTTATAVFHANRTTDIGGAIYTTESLTMTDSIFTDNTAGTTLQGGAARADVDVTIVHSTFSGNSAGWGGAVLAGASATVTSSTFVANVATSDNPFGGALYAGSTAIVTGSTFTGNIASNAGAGEGGAIVAGGAATITGGSFGGNTAGFEGGAISAYGPAIVTGVDFTGNTATYYGGAIYAADRVSSVGSDFTANSAVTGGGAGGAIFGSVEVDITGGSFADNSAGASGGAIYGASQTVSVSDATFMSNSSGDAGGAIYSHAGVTSDPSTYADNTAATGGAIYANGDVATDGDTFLRNTARTFSGGAIEADGAVVVFNGTFTDNSAATYGGAIHSAAGGVATTSTDFEGNRAGQAGGAVFTLGEWTSDTSVFTDNTSWSGSGGAINANTIRSVGDTFERNVAVTLGGAVVAVFGGSISDGTFKNNSTGDYGGAVYADTGDLVLVGGSFEDNVTTAVSGGGGAVSVGNGNVRARGTFFVGNSAPGAGAAGGAILAYGGGGIGAIEITGGLFTWNSAGGAGGALYAYGDVTVDGAEFVENTANTGDGGAIWAGDDASLLNASFVRNRAPDEWAVGGAVRAQFRISATASLFLQNYAEYAGGALDTYSLEGVGIVNSTFVENVATTAGGAVAAPIIEVTNGTFVDNSAATGSHISGTFGQTDLTATDTIFSGGTCNLSSSTPSGVNLTTDASCPGTVVTEDDLALLTLADNGGPTFTVALGDGSVALDASPTCAVDVDQRGVSRPQAVACDPGAYEADNLTTITTQASAGGVDLLAGAPTISSGDAVTDLATVRGSRSDGTGGYVDPTSGSVNFYVCSDTLVAPTECTSGTWTFIGNAEMSGGTSTTDGVATAALEDFTAPGGWAGGWHLISAVYDGSGGTYLGSSTTGDTAHELVYVRQSVNVFYNGPWRVSSSSPLRRVVISAIVTPQVPGCEVDFEVSSNTDYPTAAALYSATTGTNGVASVTLTGPSDIYDLYGVRVSVRDTACTPRTDDLGTLAVLPGSVANGSVGGGRTRTASTRAHFGYSMVVSTIVKGQTTTTVTKGSLLWMGTWSGTKYRIKTSLRASTTDGSSPWIAYPTCEPPYVDVSVGTASSTRRCGEFSGYATLQELSADTDTWIDSTFGTVWYTVRAYDAGVGCVMRGKHCHDVELVDWFGIAFRKSPLGTLLPMSYAPVELNRSSGNGSITTGTTSLKTNGQRK